MLFVFIVLQWDGVIGEQFWPLCVITHVAM